MYNVWTQICNNSYMNCDTDISNRFLLSCDSFYLYHGVFFSLFYDLHSKF